MFCLDSIQAIESGSSYRSVSYLEYGFRLYHLAELIILSTIMRPSMMTYSGM